MKRILYLDPKIGTAMAAMSMILSMFCSFRPKHKSNESISSNIDKKSNIVLNKNILLRTIMLAIATVLIIWIQWSAWKNTLVSQLIAMLMLLKGGVGIVSETVTGIETVHDEIIQNDSKNLSDKGKAFLLYLCFVIMLLLIACQEWLSSVITRSVDVSGYKDLVIIVIVIIWYFLLLFPTLCVSGTVFEVIVSCIGKMKIVRKNKHANLKQMIVKIDAAKPVQTCVMFISGRKRRIIRLFLYALLLPVSFCIGVVLSGILLILDTIGTIIQYVTEARSRIICSLRYVYKKIRGIGERKYIWVCFRFSIMISVVIAVGLFYKHQILQESTLQIFVFASETLIIPFIITEIARIKEVFGET